MNTIVRASAASQSGSKLDNRRMLAALIDLAVVGAGAAAILVAAGVLGGDGGSVGAPLAAVVAGWALYYYFACESGGGQTLGKKLLNLRVVTVDGRAPGMRDVAVRTVLRLVDTALVGLVSMLATGERRARLGDMAAGTMIVSTEAGPAPRAATAAPVVEAPVVEAPGAEETPRVPEMRPFEPYAEEEADEAPDAPYRPVMGEGFEEAPEGEEPALGEPAAEEPVVEVAEPVSGEPVADEPVVEAQVVHAVEPAGAEPVADEPVADADIVEADEPAPEEPAGEAGETLSDAPAGDLVEPDFGARGATQPVSGPELSVVEQPAVELSVIEAPPAVDPEGPAARVEAVPAADHSLDIATPSLKELAHDVQAAKEQPVAEPVIEVAPEPFVEVAPEPVVEVDVAGPEVDVDEPGMSVRSVETVSAIDLIMGGGESSEDAPADDHPPATA